MKKSKLEIGLQYLDLLLIYLNNHKIQGRILFVGVSASLILLAFKYVAPELLLIINATNCN